MQKFNYSPSEMIKSAWRHRALIVSLINREVVGRYRGSVFGILWSFFHPIFMLLVYTFVFSVVFNARWSGGGNSKTEFALVLFAGLLIFNMFAECVSRAPSLILANINYVKKVVFPLEILPWVSLGSSLFHTAISFMVWVIFYFIFFGIPKLTILLFPLVMIPLILVVMGLSWILASLGVFLRDVGQIISLLVTVMMFLSPIFYPVSALPEAYRGILYLNPLTVVIEQARDVLIWGKVFDISIYLTYLFFSILIATLGFFWFQKTRKGFADVL